MLFDSVTVGIFVLLAGFIGYAIGGIRASLGREAATIVRPLTRQERDEVVALLAAGESISAIRRVRELTGSDLAAAHSAVTRLQHELDPRLMSDDRDRAL
jgi:ribosomal protein L7/L12